MKNVEKGGRRPGKRRTARGVISLAIVAAVVVGGAFVWKGRQGNTVAAPPNTIVELTKGDLSKTISSTGSLVLADTADVSYGFDITLKEIKADVGQRVAKGDVLASVDIEALHQAIANLTGELNQLEARVAQAAKGYETTGKLRATSAGRIKAIYGAKGDDATQIVAAHGGLALLSLDEKLQLEVSGGGRVKGDSVTVTQGESTYEGTIESVQDGRAVVTFTDNGPTLEDEATVTDQDGNMIGSGTPQVHMALFTGTDAEGTISQVHISLNSRVNNGASLFSLEAVPVSNDYALALMQRDEKAKQILVAKELVKTGLVTAPQDGIVKSIAQINANGTGSTADSVPATLYVGDHMEMTVSVDELDILDVKTGQAATLVMDALEDERYEAEVSKISEIGSSSSGVTTYQVTLSLKSDEQLKMGMNGTATIVVEERTGVVLVPLMALQSSKEGQYVWLYNGSADGAEPGTKTIVTTGLSNDSYVEVTDGLKDGDKVVIVRTASTSGQYGFGMGGMMGGMDGGSMPQRGDFGGGQGESDGPDAPDGGQRQAPGGN